jgi:hypothetical protein
MNSIRTLAVAIFATLLTSVAAYAGDPTGTWKFGGEGPNGRSVDTTLTLKWHDNQLSGTIDNRAGKVAITNATFADDRVAFAVEREIGRRFRKQKITVNYSGKLEGDTIKGTIETIGREKKPLSLPWEATRGK